jgi:Transposase, Mutator family
MGSISLSPGDCLIFGVTGPDTPRLLGGEGPAVTETIEPMAAQIDQQQLAEDLVAQAREEGVQLVGEGGLLTGLTKAVVETALEEEISGHLGYDKHDPAGRNGGNSGNGVRSTTVMTEIGSVQVEVPRDRDGSFEPQIVRKRQRRLDGIDQIVLSLTARGLTTGEVAAHFAEVYGAGISKDTISRITDTVVEEMTEWRNRPLDRVYPVIFIDAIVVKVRDGQVVNRPVYVVIGVTVNGERDILGLWAGDGSEGAKFWLAVLTEIRNRGVEDVCIAVCDGLKGLPESITTTWQYAQVQASSVDTVCWRDGLAGHRATGRGPVQTRRLRGPHADLSLRVEAGRVVASGSRASSAVMRFQHGQPVGDVSGEDVASAGLFSGRVDRRGRSVHRSGLG